MKQYLDLMRKVLTEGTVHRASRENMPRTKEIFPAMIQCNLADGFPLLTTKKMYFRGVMAELLWFLRGSTDVRELWKMNCHIWDQDCYRLYQRKHSNEECLTFDEWKNQVSDIDSDYDSDYDCGEIYGRLWRAWPSRDGKPIDQICNLVNMILYNPNSRYQMVSAWNPEIVAKNQIALPSCHCYWQTNVSQNSDGQPVLNLAIYQRSCDLPLGVPFNLASYSALLHILSTLTSCVPGTLTWIGGSVHIYENQVSGCNEQLSRLPYKLPKFSYSRELIELFADTINDEYASDELTEIFNEMKPEDFIIENYQCHPKIEFPLSTGLVKDSYERVWQENYSLF